MSFFDSLLDYIGDDAGSPGGDGGGDWASALGGIVDRLSGDGGRESLLRGLADRGASYLPDDLREVAGSLFGGEGGGSWRGSLLDAASAALPEEWRSVAGAALGHSLGEGGLEGLLERGLGELGGGTARPDDLPEPPVPALDTGTDPDPRVTTHADDLLPAHDDLVTSRGAPTGPGADDGDPPAPDPTFPDDPGPVDVDPMDDFHQAVEAADHVEEQMDDMFEGLE